MVTAVGNTLPLYRGPDILQVLETPFYEKGFMLEFCEESTPFLVDILNHVFVKNEVFQISAH